MKLRAPVLYAQTAFLNEQLKNTANIVHNHLQAEHLVYGA